MKLINRANISNLIVAKLRNKQSVENFAYERNNYEIHVNLTIPLNIN